MIPTVETFGSHQYPIIYSIILQAIAVFRFDYLGLPGDKPIVFANDVFDFSFRRMGNLNPKPVIESTGGTLNYLLFPFSP